MFKPDFRPDVYYGDVAARYDASRSVKPKWRKEIEAVEALLTDGPVLDVPIGTGRFIPTYRTKGLTFSGIDTSADMLSVARSKFGEINSREGSIFDIQGGQKFGTIVCVRFLEWLPLDVAGPLLQRLSSIAGSLIVSINHGVEGKPDAHTYDFGKFLSAIDGLFIEGRHVTARIKNITSEIFKLRSARWSDVLDQFQEPEGAEVAVQRIADKHAAFFGLQPIPLNQTTATVRAEYWSGERIGAAIAALAEHRFITNEMPRRDDLPLTALMRNGRTFILDGRKRANIWMKAPGPHGVLVVTC